MRDPRGRETQLWPSASLQTLPAHTYTNNPECILSACIHSFTLRVYTRYIFSQSGALIACMCVCVLADRCRVWHCCCLPAEFTLLSQDKTALHLLTSPSSHPCIATFCFCSSSSSSSFPSLHKFHVGLPVPPFITPVCVHHIRAVALYAKFPRVPQDIWHIFACSWSNCSWCWSQKQSKSNNIFGNVAKYRFFFPYMNEFVKYLLLKRWKDQHLLGRTCMQQMPSGWCHNKLISGDVAGVSRCVDEFL